MDHYNKACSLIGLHAGIREIYPEFFAYKAMIWASENIADFYVSYDDLDIRWEAGGIMLRVWADSFVAVMVNLIITYVEENKR